MSACPRAGEGPGTGTFLLPPSWAWVNTIYKAAFGRRRRDLAHKAMEDNRPTGTADERYRLLIEAVTDYAIYMLDAEGIVASWNPGAQRFKGYEAGEIIGQHFSRFYTEEDRNSVCHAHCVGAGTAPANDDDPRTTTTTRDVQATFFA
jgi:PAS domain-containing protein